MRRRGRPPTQDVLTPREWEVLELLRQGLSNREIAERLGISYDGARYHVSEILSKLGLSSRDEAAAWQPEATPTERPWGFMGGLLLKAPDGLLGKAAATALVGAGAFGIGLLALSLIVMQGRSAATMGKVAYVVDGNVWVKELPDSTPNQITDSGSGLAPEWSASGEWLSFYRESPPGGSAETWIVRADGTDARTLGDTGPAFWSPTDDRFAVGFDLGLAVESADGSQRTELVPPPDDPYDTKTFGAYTWSPDGQWISFEDVSGLAPGSEFTGPRYNFVYRIRADGGGPPIEVYRQLVRVWDSPPEDEIRVQVRQHGWSSDGQTYLLSRSMVPGVEYDAALSAGEQPDEGFQLVTVSLVEGSIVETGITSRAYSLPRSPNGDSVLVNAGVDLRNWLDRRITLFEPSSGDVFELTNADFAALDPSWSPNGRQIAYTSAPAGPDVSRDDPTAIRAFSERHIWAMNGDGSNQRQLTNDSAYRDEHATWTADEEYILFARIGLLEPDTDISLWLLHMPSGDVELVADDIFTSQRRLMGRPYDVRSDPSPLWGQLFAYWQPD